jgi:hypothetical protein
MEHMKRVVVGYYALKHHLPDMKRQIRDIDVFVLDKGTDTPETLYGLPVESFYHPGLRDYKWTSEIATLDELYTIKISHIFWATAKETWQKHFNDILLFQHKTNAKFIPELYETLYSVWESHYGRKKVNLEQNPEDFFNNKVTRIYDHDSIHASIAYYDEPLFNRILRDGHQVAVDKTKFDALSEEDKHKLVREEVYATALERRLIPSGYKEISRFAYDWAFHKTVTSFTKGWFPLYIILNAKELRKPDVDFVQVHKDNNAKLIPLTE